ncbi:response regulator [Citreicella sp. C3M06]|uniref:response regulator n=1 Tax=Roseobacteraceae TaxID=2854170 RepID=UPI001C092CB6|nr:MULTISPECIES: response regulator [Roseobacteraceae]MBU2962449.1 response regulator [Citreicella sp. C3M06]MDO6588000.1 response regulator [Salipiger sp. 1_MG-2023]
MSDTTKTILVIEDSAADREMFRRVLKQVCAPRFEISFAHDLKTARQFLTQAHFALIILDNVLPDGYGADFVSELGQSKAWRRIPVLVVSDWPTPFMFDKVRNARAEAILSKDNFRAPVIRPYIEKMHRTVVRA